MAPPATQPVPLCHDSSVAGLRAQEELAIRPPNAGNSLSRTWLVFWYAVFAALSIGSNLGSQSLSFHLYQGAYAVPGSVCVGTGVGLIVKYLLDKAWIFRYEHRSVSHGVRTFALYAAMGLGTTLVFWSIEFCANAIFHNEAGRLVGGALGLVIGYITKYQLDKRFVFA
jgi:putative flippase GtrA